MPNLSRESKGSKDNKMWTCLLLVMYPSLPSAGKRPCIFIFLYIYIYMDFVKGSLLTMSLCKRGKLFRHESKQWQLTSTD